MTVQNQHEGEVMGEVTGEVETIKIDPNGRYVMLMDFSLTSWRAEDARHLQDKLRQELAEWWAGPEKFFVLGYRNIGITLERVDGEPSSKE
jgi:hypothetical protein